LKTWWIVFLFLSALRSNDEQLKKKRAKRVVEVFDGKPVAKIRPLYFQIYLIAKGMD
jgi:hypothetical protein